MASIQLVNRMISAEAELEGEKIKRGSLADHEWTQLCHKTISYHRPDLYRRYPAYPSLNFGQNAEDESRTQRSKLCVDYLQLMRGDQGGTANRKLLRFRVP
jgi:replicative DNA helicase